ncbi:MAG: TIM-barrel domain-containing protein, partial [Dorea sp.]
MICKYVFGHPMDTHAVVAEMSESKRELSVMQAEMTENSIRLFCHMEDEDVVFGLGEQVRGMNKRGFSYISNATDDPHHTENKHSLYGAHNFLILNRAKKSAVENKVQSFGIFVDDPGTVIFDVGETRMDELVITAGKDCVIYVVEGESLKDIVKQFRKLIGTSYIAPKWAFGYQQSRWSYMTEDEVREVVDGHHQNG